MSRLKSIIEAQNTLEKKQSATTIPSFSMNGKPIKDDKKQKKQKKLAMAIFIMTGFFVLLYIPGIVMGMFEKKTETNLYVKSPDYTILKQLDNQLATNPTLDFDNDGIDNAKEITEGTDPYNSDSDYDGLSDYYELYVSKTSPLTDDSSILIEMQKKLDAENNKNVSSPYQMENVILWADDYNSKALGGVVETMNGYNFYKFNGYAQFPGNKGKYIYGKKDGEHIKLKYLEDENAYRITDDLEGVEFFNEPLEEVISYNFFKKNFYSKTNFFTNAISFILPNRGFITAQKKLRIDCEVTAPNEKVTSIKKINYDETNFSRFNENQVDLTYLQYVKTNIDNDKCVAVSLLDTVNGEYRGIIYGYSASYLLIADTETLQPVGKIHFSERARKCIDNSGNLSCKSYLTWEGLGYSYFYGNRINFFAISD